ncbi:hypothetical protein H5407_14270 [Mitsuaria sp. WAJ17]|uniref:hypothetical protein n=1 Tax=Mitsuaria sp. WAJ17 TaxID=2761452 RepID=UPI00160401ED|nr:hypothetical protein [Mitsuaria sp. WAJ17]MBB2486386.1 hypothetical protein [Mitsuaria sp. WAJ17]
MSLPRRTRLWPAVALHAWLALCLLLAQGLGQGHRAAHQGFRLAAAAVEQGSSDAWGHALGSTDCQLFDQLAHGDQVSGASPHTVLLTLATVTAPGPEPVSAEASPAIPRARGPPFLA